jgi:hypothetical protein
VNGGRNYNGPKVIFVALVKFGYMLETLSIWRYPERKPKGDNATSADNQQERLDYDKSGILRDYTPNTHLGEDIVRTSWRHVEVGRNDRLARNGGNRLERNSLSGE